MNSNFLIFGASGLIGGHFKEICENNGEAFISVGRRYIPKLDANKQHIVNFDTLETLPKSESCVICLGYPLTSYQLIRMGKKTKQKFYKVDFEYVQRIAGILKKNGTKNLAVISSLGASKYSPNFYLRTKGLMEDSLKKLSFDKLIIARPAHLLGDREVPRNEIGITIIELFDKVFKNFLIGPFKKYRNIHGSVVSNKIYDTFGDSYEPGIYIIENDKIKKI